MNNVKNVLGSKNINGLNPVLENAPALYVGTYHKYNCGSLFGEWVYLENFTDKGEFIEYCELLHSDEDDAEFMYQDLENYNLLELFYSECSISSKYWEFLEACNNDQIHNIKAFEAFIEWLHSDVEKEDIIDLIAKFNDNYICENNTDMSNEEFIGYYAVEELRLLEVPENIVHFFNYEAYGFSLTTSTIAECGNFFFYNS